MGVIWDEFSVLSGKLKEIDRDWIWMTGLMLCLQNLLDQGYTEGELIALKEK